MSQRSPAPGVERVNRMSDEGLQRLEHQLSRGGISDAVLAQWIRRYGTTARKLIRQYDRYIDAFDNIPDPG